MVKRLVRVQPYDVRWAHKFMVLCFYDQTFNKVQYYCQELISLSIRIHGQSWDQTRLHFSHPCIFLRSRHFLPTLAIRRRQARTAGGRWRSPRRAWW